VHLTEENRLSLYIPEGFAHGFITLTDNVELLYFHTEFYHPEYYAGVQYSDPKFNIKLETEVQIISEKDKNLPFLPDNFQGLEV
jgi:dTDP-4-dehydrorhamnose 3,5-epimerase